MKQRQDHARAVHRIWPRRHPTVLGGMDANIEWREAENNPYQRAVRPGSGPTPY